MALFYGHSPFTRQPAISQGESQGIPRERDNNHCNSDNASSCDLFPEDVTPGIPSHVMGHQHNVIPIVMEEIRGTVGKPLQELQNEMKQLRADVTRLKEQQSQESNRFPRSTKKGRLPKILTVCFFVLARLLFLCVIIIVSC